MSERRGERRPSRARVRVFEGFVLTGFLAASLAALLLVKGGDPAAVQLMEPQGRLWWKWLLALFVPIALGLGLLVIVGATLLRRKAWGRVALQIFSAAIFLAVVIGNRRVLMSIFNGASNDALS